MFEFYSQEYKKQVVQSTFRPIEEDETQELLKDPEKYYGALQAVSGDVNMQLAAYRANGESGDTYDDDRAPRGEEWRRKAGSVKTHLDRRLSDLRPFIRDYRRQKFSSRREVVSENLLDDIRELRGAIHRHKERVAEDYSPTDADLELWEVLKQNDVEISV